MPVCTNCGHDFKTKWNDNKRFVKSCPKCIKLFPDDAIDKMIQDFFK